MTDTGPTTITAQVAKRIREARRAAGMTQEQLARQVGLSRVSIVNIERGRQGIDVGLLGWIAYALRVDARDLLPGPAVQARRLTDEEAILLRCARAYEAARGERP